TYSPDPAIFACPASQLADSTPRPFLSPPNRSPPMITLPVRPAPRAVLLLALLAVAMASSEAGAAEWLQPSRDDDQPTWGLQGGLQFAIPPAGFPKGPGGPRGLIRVGYPILPDGEYHLVNFLAVEPIVRGQKGFSEL